VCVCVCVGGGVKLEHGEALVCARQLKRVRTSCIGLLAHAGVSVHGHAWAHRNPYLLLLCLPLSIGAAIRGIGIHISHVGIIEGLLDGVGESLIGLGGARRWRRGLSIRG
jgi:hypothetical protein